MSKLSGVLIIDDELGPREALRMALKKDYRVYVAEDGYKGIDLLKEEDIDLVISDIRMPNLSGLGVLKHVKEYDPSIEVILFTGYGSIENAKTAAFNNVFAYLCKPCNILELRNLVREGIDQRHKNRENS